MDVTEKTIEIRGVRRSEIIDYFVGINGKDNKCGKVTGEDWEVELSEEKFISIGALKFASTMVTFRFKEEIFDQMLADFRMKFMRMGG